MPDPYTAAVTVAVAASGAVLLHQWCAGLTAPRELTAAKMQHRERRHHHHHHHPTGLQRKAAQFSAFHWRFLLGHTILAMADWMQGPYLLAMYRSFGLSPTDVGRLFMTDYAAAGALGILSGIAGDTVGPKAMCVAYGLIYAVACACNHFPEHFGVMTLGVALDGLCNALLRTGFEGYAVAAGVAEGFPASWTAHLLAVATWLAACSSIAAGVVCFWIVQWWGGKKEVGGGPAAVHVTPFVGAEGGGRDAYVATMDAAIALLLVGTMFVWRCWPAVKPRARPQPPHLALTQQRPQLGEMSRRALGASCESIADALRLLRMHPSIRAKALVELGFEGALLAFIALYPEAIFHVDPAAPFGLSFTALVACVVVGCSAFNLVNSLWPERSSAAPDAAAVNRARRRAVAFLLAAAGAVAAAAAATVTACVVPAAPLDEGARLGACGALFAATSAATPASGRVGGGPGIAEAVPLVLLCLGSMEVAFGFFYPALGTLHAYDDAPREAQEVLGRCRHTLVALTRAAAYVLAIATMLLVVQWGLVAGWMAIAFMASLASCSAVAVAFLA